MENDSIDKMKEEITEMFGEEIGLQFNPDWRCDDNFHTKYAYFDFSIERKGMSEEKWKEVKDYFEKKSELKEFDNDKISGIVYSFYEEEDDEYQEEIDNNEADEDED